MDCTPTGPAPAAFDLALLGILRDGPSYGHELARTVNTSKQRVSVALRRLAQQGLVTAHQEAGNPQDLQRPLRRYYQLTPAGSYILQQSLERFAVGTTGHDSEGP